MQSMGITNYANIAQGERYCSVTESQTNHIGKACVNIKLKSMKKQQKNLLWKQNIGTIRAYIITTHCNAIFRAIPTYFKATTVCISK
jgi:hypothetical protein